MQSTFDRLLQSQPIQKSKNPYKSTYPGLLNIGTLSQAPSLALEHGALSLFLPRPQS